MYVLSRFRVVMIYAVFFAQEWGFRFRFGIETTVFVRRSVFFSELGKADTSPIEFTHPTFLDSHNSNILLNTSLVDTHVTTNTLKIKFAASQTHIEFTC